MDNAYPYAVARADLNSNAPAEIISHHRTLEAAGRAATKWRGTAGAIGMYIARRKPCGNYESRDEWSDRMQRMHRIEG